ncbi:cell division protein FtsH [Candidatus Campbellbacteria bacterium]|nr:MAG: cell division protein FtsH [Candidatus Campbellbacteria bacterium]
MLKDKKEKENKIIIKREEKRGNKKNNKKNKKPTDKLFGQILNIVLIILLVIFVTSFLNKEDKEQKISISEISTKVKSGEVKEILVELNDLKVKTEDDKVLKGKKETESSLSETLKNFGVTDEQIVKANIKVQNPTSFGYYLVKFSPFLFPFLLIGLLIYFMTRGAKAGAMQAFSFGDSRAKFIDPDDKKNRTTFKDIAGAKEAKAELMEVVDFLKFPKKYLDIGAEIPKGVLMMGAPGTGKTLLAKAVAGEAKVPFYSVSGSEFVEMFVGVGASRVRDLFKMAKKSAPSIIFIDEIDAIGRVRGGGTGGGNDEREQTLNQILVEMDGFDNDQKVIVMGATNRPEVLDPALLRPGRFDRRVTIDLPDKEDREKILEIHGRKKPYAEDVNLKVIAERTPGFSGADLYSLMNEGAILAASENRKKVSQYDLIRSIEKVLLGPERKSHILSENEKIRTAYHEVGHALVSSLLDYANPVHKVSIISRGRAAGYTLHLPFDDKKMNTKNDFLADIATTLGGYAAEKMIFGDVTTGPSNDLQVATKTARDMVTKYGMSDAVGVLALEDQYGGTLRGSGDGVKGSNYSGETAQLIDKEVKRIMKEQMDVAEKVLKENMEAFENISQELIERETLERPDYEALLKKNGIRVQTKEDAENLFLKNFKKKK